MEKKFNKVIAFDLDGTLLHRTTEKVENELHHFTSNNRYIYLRPNIHHLIHHFEKLSIKSALVVWTSMQRKNAEKIFEEFHKIGLKFEKLYCQEHCVNFTKNLEVVAKDFGIDVEHAYLVDDTPHKRIGNQNYMHIKTYDGKEANDSEIVRIIEELYEILGIEIDDEFHNSDEIENISKHIERLYLGENEKNISGNCQNKTKNVKPKKKFIEKKEIKEENIQQEVEIKNRELNENLKLIVFDLNKTLVAKRKEEDPDISELKSQKKIQGSLIYKRPHLDLLQKFLEIHPNIDIEFIVWTTMTGKKVVSNCQEVVNDLGVKFSGVINGVESKESAAKDLREACKKYGCKIENALLIDDSPYKQIQGQNFFNIFPFRGEKQDIEMIRVVGELDKFIKCENADCYFKQMVLKYERELKEAREYHEIKLKEDVEREKEKQGLKLHKEEEAELKEKFRTEGYKIKHELSLKGHIKCVVFDINETLLVRSQTKIADILVDFKSKHYFNYLRPYLEDLRKFFEEQKIQICLWSTIREVNCKPFWEILEGKGFKFDARFCGENLVEGKKDLELVSKTLNIPVENIVLVDDSPKKSVNGQNFIQIESFDPLNQKDDALLYLIKDLYQLCTKPEEKI